MLSRDESSPSLSVGLGIPIPILNEEMARFTAVSDDEIFTHVMDDSDDYPKASPRSLAQVSDKALKSGAILVDGEVVQAVPLSSRVKAQAIAEALKGWLQRGAVLPGKYLIPKNCIHRFVS